MLDDNFWYPFFPKKFKSATRHLTAEQDGIYRRLIDEYMETREPLPDNDIALARIAGVSEINWLDASRILRAFFTHKNGLLFHPFCDQQLDIQDKKTKIRKNSAEKAAKKRWSKNDINQKDECVTHTNRNTDAMRADATETETETVLNTSVFNNPLPPKRGVNEVSIPEWIPPDVWKAFLDMRKAIKKPATPRAQNLIIKKTEELTHDTATRIAIIDQSIRNGWQDVYALKTDQPREQAQVAAGSLAQARPASGYRDERSEATKALDIAEQIIAKRNAAYAAQGRPAGAEPAHAPVSANLFPAEKVR